MGTTSADSIYEQLADLQTAMLALSDFNQDFRVTLHEIAAGIQNLNRMLAHEYLETDHLDSVTLQANVPLVLNRRGRRFITIFSPVTVTNIAVNMLGITGYTLTLNPGWNTLNGPDGTTLTPAAGTNQPIMVKCTNYNQAGAI